MQWLKKLARALKRENRYRYQKTRDHKSIAVIGQIDGMAFESLRLTKFPQAMRMGTKYLVTQSRRTRNFYLGEKRRFAKWTRRRKPE